MSLVRNVVSSRAKTLARIAGIAVIVLGLMSTLIPSGPASAWPSELWACRVGVAWTVAAHPNAVPIAARRIGVGGGVSSMSSSPTRFSFISVEPDPPVLRRVKSWIRLLFRMQAVDIEQGVAFYAISDETKVGASGRPWRRLRLLPDAPWRSTAVELRNAGD